MDLQLPDRRKPTGSSFDTKPDVIKAWVDELPLINPGKSRALLNDALIQINSLSMPARNRHETLELLAASVVCVTETMKKDKGFTLSLLNIVRCASIQINELALSMFTSPNIKRLTVPTNELRHIL